MKAKLFVSSTVKEIRLEDGKFYLSNSGESTEDFIERIDTIITEEYVEEVDLSMIDLSKYKKVGSSALVKKINQTTGAEQAIIAELLESRGVAFEVFVNEPQKESPVETPSAEDKLDEESLEKQIASEPKTKRVIDLVESQKVLDEKKKNIGRSISFSCKKFDEVLTGEIMGITLDKRSGFVQYRIKTEKGIFGKNVLSDEITWEK